MTNSHQRTPSLSNRESSVGAFTSEVSLAWPFRGLWQAAGKTQLYSPCTSWSFQRALGVRRRNVCNPVEQVHFMDSFQPNELWHLGPSSPFRSLFPFLQKQDVSLLPLQERLGVRASVTPWGKEGKNTPSGRTAVPLVLNHLV